MTHSVARVPALQLVYMFISFLTSIYLSKSVIVEIRKAWELEDGRPERCRGKATQDCVITSGTVNSLPHND
jgi:hypothetical protein